MNKIYKIKFDVLSGVTQVMSELGKSCGKTGRLLATGGLALAFSLDSQAACPTPAVDSATVQAGDVCEYNGNSFMDSGRSNGVIDIRDGGSATFTATDVSLQKTNRWGGGQAEDYSAIYLRADENLVNKAVFNGNVTIYEAGAANVRDVVVGGGSDLTIHGNLLISHRNVAGALFALNADAWGNARSDTKMTIKGDFYGWTDGSDFMRVGAGNYIFEKNVNLEAVNGRISVRGATVLDFKGDTQIKNDRTFLAIDNNTLPTINFNKLSVTNTGTNEVFSLRSGITNFNNDTTITATNADVIKLYNSATFNNNGQLSITSRDGIGIRTLLQSNERASFNNLANGHISRENVILVNDGEGQVDITNAGVLKVTEEALVKNAGSGSIFLDNTGMLDGYVNSSDSDGIDITNIGTWKNTNNSVLDGLINTGTIEFVKPEDNSHLTIEVDEYTGGGTLIMNTIWNDDSADINGVSTSDKLKIRNLLGNDVTTVKISAAQIGTITQKDRDIYSIDIIEVENPHSGNLFVGRAATTGAKEAQLQRNGNNYRWSLQAISGQDIFSQSISGYVQLPYINRQMGLAQLGQLHQRIGEQEKKVDNSRVWGRLHLDSQNLQGDNRFGSKVRSGFAQFGQDIVSQYDQEGREYHTGLTATYGWANMSFYDKYKAENGEVVSDKYTGKGKTHMFSVGGYYTYYTSNGAYMDSVAQASYFHNQYHSEQHKVSQHGYGLGASIEVGKSYTWPTNPNLAIEPQAQLTYQWIKLSDINDGVREVQGANQHNLNARLGGRLTWKTSPQDKTPFLYFSTNLIQTLIGRETKVRIGQEQLKENFGGLTLEFGVGGEYEITKNLNLYADVRYHLSLDNHHNSVYRNSHLAKEGYNGRVGVKYSW